MSRSSYLPLNETTLPGYLAGIPAVVARLGPDPARWRVREVGDGNLNLVFIVEGANPPDPGSAAGGGPAGVVVKQALPYLRLVGESWPLRKERNYFEFLALREQAKFAGRLVPAVFHADREMALMVMEYLTPHVILRKGLIRGTIYPRLAADVAEFLAQSLFRTSDLFLPSPEKRRLQAVFCDNYELCEATENIIFTDPYRVAKLNRWTSPQLDARAAACRQDTPLKIAVQQLKRRFLTSGEALVHGDLHTGSVMVSADDTRVIDPEFAFFGPMGFDVGAFLANLLLAYFAQAGHEARPGERDGYRAWILAQLRATWEGFAARFDALWRTEAAASRGGAYPADLFADPAGAAALAAERGAFLRELFADALGFAGVKMIRRIFGVAHVEDLESIVDPDRRAACEAQALTAARRLVIEAASFGSIGAVADWTEAVRAGGTSGPDFHGGR